MYSTSKILGLERSHKLNIEILGKIQRSDLLLKILSNRYNYSTDTLKTTVLDHQFDNPVGVAAGFDKNAKIVPALQSIGFGFVEIGTVTPQPQEGNQKPRMFKMSKDKALINRLGFNNDGMKKIHKRLNSYNADIPIGLNIGKMNKSDSTQAFQDYRSIAKFFGDYPSYYVLNVSCPNTPDKYDESAPSNIRENVNVVSEQLNNTPVLIKVSPDETSEQLKSLAEIVEKSDISGIIATNTTEDRSAELESKYSFQSGGLSGRPLFSKSNDTIKYLYSSTNVPIIGVGGVDNGRTAYQKIISGASLVQLYTGIVYEGLKSAYKINSELDQILEKNGFDNVREAVGVAAD